MSKTDHEIFRKTINDSTDAGTSQFRFSIRAVYGGIENGLLDHVGTCVFLSINNKKYILTAAHIADQMQNMPFYIIGASNELVRIQGNFLVTKEPKSGRKDDHYDFAWGNPSNRLIKLCGENDFITEEKIIRSTEDSEGRIYLALGYPYSKNKLARFERKIIPKIFQYADMVKYDEGLSRKLRVSGRDHFFLKYNFKHSKNEEEKLVNSIKPVGLSGGALVDMGIYSELAKSFSKPNGKLAGMLIEMHRDYKAIVAVKMDVIINVIKREQIKGGGGFLDLKTDS